MIVDGLGLAEGVGRVEGHALVRAHRGAGQERGLAVAGADQLEIGFGGIGLEQVIHVAFGPGGGRIQREPRLEPHVVPQPSGKEPVADVYTQTEVARLLGMTRGRLRSLDRAGIVSPSGRRRGGR